MRDKPTRLYRLLEERIVARPVRAGGAATLAEWVASRRPATSWKALAPELTEVTGIEVSWEALRLWFAAEEQVEQTADAR
jgi:hypothetical protein